MTFKNTDETATKCIHNGLVVMDLCLTKQKALSTWIRRGKFMFGLSADKEKVIFRAITFDLCWCIGTIVSQLL